MENIVYERDYAEEHRRAAERVDLESSIFDASIDTGFWKAYGEMMDAIPKVIVPEDKAAYEDLLPRLDELARRLGGKIRGEVRYDKWLSEINVILPYLEFGDDDEYELFKDLAAKTHLFTVTATEDGQVRVHVMINYFKEIEDATEAVEGMIAENKELSGLLIQSIDRYNRKAEQLATALNPLLDYAEEQTGRDRTELFNELVSFLAPYSNRLDEGIKKYIEFIGGQA